MMEGAMPLRKEQDEVYRNALDEMKRQIVEIDQQTEKEIQRVKAKLSALQETKKALVAACAGIARIVGEAAPESGEDATRPEPPAADRGRR